MIFFFVLNQSYLDFQKVYRDTISCAESLIFKRYTVTLVEFPNHTFLWVNDTFSRYGAP